jgi:hypothetical protein
VHAPARSAGTAFGDQPPMTQFRAQFTMRHSPSADSNRPRSILRQAPTISGRLRCSKPVARSRSRTPQLGARPRRR